MRDAVRSKAYDFNTEFESDIPFFYQDVKGLVSIGVGLLCDPMHGTGALNLPLVKLDGTPAGRDEIAAEWLKIKSLPPDSRGRTAAQLGWTYAKPHTTLHLTDEGLRFTFDRKLAQNLATLKRGFPEFDEWNADAQLGAISLAWAVGPGYWSPDAGARYFPKCTAAMRARDWFTASTECFLPEESRIGGLRPRNKANRILFMNAAAVDQQGLDPDVLHYPRDLTKAESSAPPAVDNEVLTAQIVHSMRYAGLPGFDRET